MALAWILGLAAVLVIMGFTGSFQVSGARRTLERLHARRIVDLVVASAMEEACRRIELSAPSLPVPSPGLRRDLATGIAWPRLVEPELTRQTYAQDRITLSPVEIASSTWELELETLPDRSRMVREVGVLQLHARARIQVGTTTLDRQVVARRYVAAIPEPDGKSARIHIQSNDLVVEERE